MNQQIHQLIFQKLNKKKLNNNKVKNFIVIIKMNKKLKLSQYSMQCLNLLL